MYKTNAWKKYTGEKLDALMQFNKEYIDFLSCCKTERLCVEFAVEQAKKKGFKDFKDVKSLKAGDKVYFTNRNKNINLFVIGKKDFEEGLRVLGAHIDSPRIDVKQNPLYEDHGFALLDAHYYGGIKKYQWVTIPLALYGVVCLKDGKTIKVAIGDNENDPVLGIGDLLIHLAKDQLSKNAAEVIGGEQLDLTVGHMPLEGTEKDAVKANVLKVLKDRYGFEETDFVSAELEIVPQGRAHDYGLDKSMVAGYGQDDRVCAYTSLRALLDLNEVPEYTCCCQLVDKEEVGSIGATGCDSYFFEDNLYELAALLNKDVTLAVKRCLSNSKMLSSDVSAGYDPLFASVNEPKNSAYLGEGLCFNKYTGARGKSGCNDAMPEFIAEIREALDKDNINYQSSELGKVDQGGGGTIAYIMGNKNMWVIDAGVAVLNMHSPMEITSKVDVYEAYLGYISFLTHLK